jgi:hypothetical protein
VRELLEITPRHIFNRILANIELLRPEPPAWAGECRRSFFLPRSAVERLKAVYGSARLGLEAVAAAAVAETKRKMEELAARLDGAECIALTEAAGIMAGLGYSDFGARFATARLLERLGLVRIRVGHKVYYCRPGASPPRIAITNGSAIRAITRKDVTKALEELASGCVSKSCRIRLGKIAEALGLRPTAQVMATIADIVASLGYKVECFGGYRRRCYAVV